MHNHSLRNFCHDNASSFEKQLSIDTIQNNPNHRKPNSYWMIFDLTTSMTLSAIRRHDVVTNFIAIMKGRQSLYRRSTSNRGVVSIGFVTGTIPRYKISANFSEHLRTTISMKCKTKRFPPFLCVHSRISAPYRGRSFSPEAFEHSGAPRGDRQSTVVGLICKALPAQEPQSIMFAVTAITARTDLHPEVHRIVSIKGIPESDMFSYEETLRRESPWILKIFGSWKLRRTPIRKT
jgi:hypothetical protein